MSIFIYPGLSAKIKKQRKHLHIYVSHVDIYDKDRESSYCRLEDVVNGGFPVCTKTYFLGKERWM